MCVRGSGTDALAMLSNRSALPRPPCRLGDEKKQGRWSVDETERLREAVAEYLAARTAAEQQEGVGGDEATLTLEDIEGAPLQRLPVCCLMASPCSLLTATEERLVSTLWRPKHCLPPLTPPHLGSPCPLALAPCLCRGGGGACVGRRWRRRLHCQPPHCAGRHRLECGVTGALWIGLCCACCALCCAAALCRMTSIGMCVGMGIAITAATAPVLMAILTAWPCCCRPWAAAPTCSAWRSGTASCRPQWLHAGSGARVTTGACSAPSSSGTGLWLETLTGSGVGVCGWCRVVQRPAGAAAGQLLRTQSLAAAVFSMGAPNLHSPCV